MGLVYAWFLRELWNEFSLWYGFLAIIGSLAIDLDHAFYMFFYGRHEPYAQEARKILKAGQIGTFFRFMRDNHKHNTSLASHNIYFIAFFTIVSILAAQFDLKSAVAFFGAIVLHLIFDICDDIWVLGYLNENWKRLRRKKTTVR